MNSRKNFKHLLFAAGIFFALFIFTSSFTACSSHILDIQEGLQSAPTPTSASAPIPAPTTYTVTVTSGAHGAISVDKTNAAAGETVTITVTPEANYMLDVLSITDSSGNAIAISAAKTFTMPESDVTVSGTFKIAPPKLYTISVVQSSFGNGTIILDKTSAAAGETVTIISAVPDIGYKRLLNMYVWNVTENSRSFDVTGDSFVMPEYDVRLFYNFSKFDGKDINKILRNDLGAASTATKFLPSPSAPTGNEIELYCLTTGLRVYAWLEGTTIYYYAAGYTDSNKKIPLVKSCFQLFYKCSSLQEIDMSYFDTSSVTNMGYMFADCDMLDTLNLSAFNTTSVTNMGCMFARSKKLETLDLSSFDTSKVTDMYWMFFDCSSLKTIFAGNGFDTSNVTDSTWMFDSCGHLVGGAGTKYSYGNNDKTYARIDGGPSNPGYFTRKQ